MMWLVPSQYEVLITFYSTNYTIKQFLFDWAKQTSLRLICSDLGTWLLCVFCLFRTWSISTVVMLTGHRQLIRTCKKKINMFLKLLTSSLPIPQIVFHLTPCRPQICCQLTPYRRERTSAKCATTISTILEVNSFVYIFTPKVGDGIGAYKCAVRRARGQQQSISCV